jgi:hypothetical protein
MKHLHPCIDRREALKELNAFIAELATGWERDGLGWAPALLALLRSFSAEASRDVPDSERLGDLRAQICQYFVEHKFLKGLCFVLEWIDAISGHENP